MKKTDSKETSLRIPYDVDDIVEKHEKEGEFPNYSQALFDIVRKYARNQGQYGKIINELKEQNKELKEAVEMVRKGRSVKDRQQPKSKCRYKMPDGMCGRFWLSRGKKIDVDEEDCDWCLILQQLEKTEGAKLLKSAKRREKSTSKINKKKAKELYCHYLGRWITLEFVDKHLANCKTCELTNVTLWGDWAECLKKQQQLRNE